MRKTLTLTAEAGGGKDWKTGKQDIGTRAVERIFSGLRAPSCLVGREQPCMLSITPAAPARKYAKALSVNKHPEENSNMRKEGSVKEKWSDSDCRSRPPTKHRTAKGLSWVRRFEDRSSIFGFFGIAFSWASPTAFLFPRLLAHVILGLLTSNLDDSWLNCLFHHLSQPKSRIYVFFTPPRDSSPVGTPRDRRHLRTHN